MCFSDHDSDYVYELTLLSGWVVAIETLSCGVNTYSTASCKKKLGFLAYWAECSLKTPFFSQVHVFGFVEGYKCVYYMCRFRRTWQRMAFEHPLPPPHQNCGPSDCCFFPHTYAGCQGLVLLGG